MWDLYDDDESFQRLARGRGFHDADLLAKVLYGKKAKKESQNEKENHKMKPKTKNVKFSEGQGRLTIDSEFKAKNEDEADFDYLWRCPDYSYKGRCQTKKGIFDPFSISLLTEFTCTVKSHILPFIKDKDIFE